MQILKTIGPKVNYFKLRKNCLVEFVAAKNTAVKNSC